MIDSKKIFILTSTRADYGVQRWIIKQLQNYSNFNTFVVVGGAHLLEKYGYTINEISRDNIKKIIQLPFLNNLTDKFSLVSSVGDGLKNISEIFFTYKPDYIILLGDRYELFICAIAALLYNSIIIHIGGGEITKGALDEQVRHAITKMAHIHMPTTEIYAENISRMGEEDWRIHIVGAPGLENIEKIELYSEKDILKLTGIMLIKIQ
jgi:GDP/UDP-N,N'-diacetylbacillosamine 2-epimerase (hydrolysing)